MDINRISPVSTDVSEYDAITLRNLRTIPVRRCFVVPEIKLSAVDLKAWGSSKDAKNEIGKQHQRRAEDHS